MGLTKPFAYLGSTAAEGPGWGTPPYDTGIQVFYEFWIVTGKLEAS